MPTLKLTLDGRNEIEVSSCHCDVNFVHQVKSLSPVFTNYDVSQCQPANVQPELACCKVGQVYRTYDKRHLCCDISEGTGVHQIR